jgi:hypothetical protein
MIVALNNTVRGSLPQPGLLAVQQSRADFDSAKALHAVVNRNLDPTSPVGRIAFELRVLQIPDALVPVNTESVAP